MIEKYENNLDLSNVLVQAVMKVSQQKTKVAVIITASTGDERHMSYF